MYSSLFLLICPYVSLRLNVFKLPEQERGAGLRINFVQYTQSYPSEELGLLWRGIWVKMGWEHSSGSGIGS